MPNAKNTSLYSSKLNSTATWLIRAVLVLVPFYALISVWASSALGHFTAIRLWDDYLLLLLVLLCSICIIKDKQIRRHLVGKWLTRLIFGYIVLTIILGLVGYLGHNVSVKALFYGLLINLRYLVWFVCVKIVAGQTKILGSKKQLFIFIPLAIVVTFGLLQFFVLPHTFLSHFGYGGSSYPQYITLNQNSPTIRIQSFLRGANELGAYLAAAMCLLLAWIIRKRKNIYFWLLFVVSALALYLTFSRSALIGFILGGLYILFLEIRNKKIKLVFISVLAGLVLILGVGYLLTKNNQAVQDVIFHHNSNSTAVVTSDQGHFTALKNNLSIVLHQPLGKGPGTSGQASWYNAGHQSRNSEDYFIQIAEEVGWLGVVLFISILVLVGRELWLRRTDAMALGLLGGLIAICTISLFSYTWSDDTLSFIWWGLAGIALAKTAPVRSLKSKS